MSSVKLWYAVVCSVSTCLPLSLAAHLHWCVVFLSYGSSLAVFSFPWRAGVRLLCGRFGSTLSWVSEIAPYCCFITHPVTSELPRSNGVRSSEAGNITRRQVVFLCCCDRRDFFEDVFGCLHAPQFWSFCHRFTCFHVCASCPHHTRKTTWMARGTNAQNPARTPPNAHSWSTDSCGQQREGVLHARVVRLAVRWWWFHGDGVRRWCLAQVGDMLQAGGALGILLSCVENNSTQEKDLVDSC